MVKKSNQKASIKLSVDVESLPKDTISGFAVTGLVLGIISVLLCWIPFLDLLLGILAFIFSIIGFKKSTKQGVAIAGIIFSSISILVGLVLTFIGAIILSAIF